MAILAAPAAAAPVELGPGELPDVFVAADGTAYIAWNGVEQGDPAHFCRLPRGASACDIARTLPLPAPVVGSTTRPIVHVAGARVTVLHFFSGEVTGLWAYQSNDGGATFSGPRLAGAFGPYEHAFGPGDTVSIVTSADGRGTLFQNVSLTGPAPGAFANLDSTRPYSGAVGLDGETPVVIAEDGASIGVVRRFVGGDPNSAQSWSAPVDIGYLAYPRLAGGPLGLWVLAGDENGGMFVRRYDGTTFGARIAVGPGDSSESALVQDGGGRLHAVFPRLDATGYHAVHAVSDDGVTWTTEELDVRPFDEPLAMRVSAAPDHIGVAVWRAGGDVIRASAVGVAQPPPTQPPPPVPTPTPTPTPEPVPVFEKSVVIRPVRGVVRVRLRGSKRFVRLTSLDDIPLGATIDTRRGRIELRSVPRPGAAPQTVQLYDGMFRVSQRRGITNFTLNEPLARCGRRAHAAAKRRKSRRLWGNGKGAFRTSGRYSAATVRGTRWMVRDSCAGTLTRVTQGSVTVRVKGRARPIIVRAGKRYLARPRR